MYYFFTFFLLFILFFLIFFHFRKRKIIRKICCMTIQEKCCLLNELTEPLGYCYDVSQDIFTSTTDAWQKKFGYGAIYDKFAPLFNMVMDCQPVYFNYEGKTWLIEFWKGQYGINTGCELGVYHADGIIPPSRRKSTIFSAADPHEYLDISVELLRNGREIAVKKGRHWWQTIFSMGVFSHPEELFMKIHLCFPETGMRNAFVEGLVAAGYDPDSIFLSICSTDVSFTFGCSHERWSLLKRIYCCFVQHLNRFYCWLYRFVTRPFTCTYDRLLYLYYYLPFAFRYMLRLRRYKRRSKKCCRKKKCRRV